MTARDFVTRRFPRHISQPIPAEAHALARKRTQHLGSVALESRLDDLLASAYMQGVADAAQVIDRIHPHPDPSMGLIT